MAGYLAMSESHTWDGHWHRPTKPESRYPGTLTWDKRSGRLSMFGAFEGFGSNAVSDTPLKLGVIHGSTSESTFATLFDAYDSGSKWSWGPAGLVETQRLRASGVVIGAHVTDETKYTELRFRTPGLHIWLRNQMLQVRLPKRKRLPSRIAMHLTQGPDIVAKIKALRLTVRLSSSALVSGIGTMDTTLQRSGYIVLSVTGVGQPLDWFIEQWGKVQTLLSFAAACGMSPDAISGRLEGGQLVDVLVALWDKEPCEHEHEYDFFISREAFGDVRIAIQKWFENFAKVDNSSKLTVRMLNDSDTLLHLQFVTLTQAFESLHRGTIGGHYMEKDRYEKEVESVMVAAIPNDIESGHRKSLQMRLKFGYELSLDRKLKDVMKALSEDVRIHVLDGLKLIPRSWIETRNYYTHWDEGTEGEILSDQDMFDAIIRMKAILILLHLKIAGLTDDALRTGLHSNAKLSRHLSQLNRQRRLQRIDPQH